MAKVHPSAAGVEAAPPVAGGGEAVALTVWRKSLLFNFDGFTAFDGKGDLVFRVDDYGGAAGGIVLMNGAGKALLTARRKKLCWRETWLVYEGEGAKQELSVRKRVHVLPSKALARVTWGGGVYDVEGSYARRTCHVYDEERRRVAEIRRKKGPHGVGLGADVFSLVVQPCFDATVAMAIVLLLEQMLGSR
ncbi:unnamed protein product [Spirodela intermedia]|uniref:Uncharacterized protein n=1 Tax=Spirodela intermedia TaxID=51605 RepID=A0A7I8KKG0_SPIIN|nr:unnamed protein product [Spirodela intermedia]